QEHFYERQDYGKPNFEYKDTHKNDESDKLQILWHWILRMAEAIDEGKKKLADELFTALSFSNPIMYEIFMYAPEITPAEFSNIYAYYNFGAFRLQKILQQNVYKTE
ncbi:21458_t:CDS:2, partial [Racocetra persica]